jgi:hypothetical protein
MPLAFQQLTMRAEVTKNSADLVSGKSRIHRNREIVQPELGFAVAGADMHVSRFPGFIRVEKTPGKVPSATRSASRRSSLLLPLIRRQQLLHRLAQPANLRSLMAALIATEAMVEAPIVGEFCSSGAPLH